MFHGSLRKGREVKFPHHTTFSLWDNPISSSEQLSSEGGTGKMGDGSIVLHGTLIVILR